MLRKRKRNGKCKYKEVSTQIRERKKVTGETPKQRRTKLVARRRLNVENNPETGGGGHPLIQILKEIDLKKENKQLRKVQKTGKIEKRENKKQKKENEEIDKMKQRKFLQDWMKEKKTTEEKKENKVK